MNNLHPIFQWLGEHPFLSFFLAYLVVILAEYTIKLFFFDVPNMILSQINTFKHGHKPQSTFIINQDPKIPNGNID